MDSEQEEKNQVRNRSLRQPTFVLPLDATDGQPNRVGGSLTRGSVHPLCCLCIHRAVWRRRDQQDWAKVGNGGEESFTC